MHVRHDQFPHVIHMLQMHDVFHAFRLTTKQKTIKKKKRFPPQNEMPRKTKSFVGHDYFTNNVARWNAIVKPHLLARSHAHPKALDIAPGNGLSTLWLLETIPNIHVTVVHTDASSFGAFQKNLAGHMRRLTVYRANNHTSYRRVLTQDLKTSDYDFVYIDLDTDARFTLDTAVYAFALLKPHGMMVFDDYTQNLMHEPSVCPKMAIDSFVSVYSTYLKVIDVSWQLVLIKRSKPLERHPCRSELYHEDIRAI